jgi:hypothetical protein
MGAVPKTKWAQFLALTLLHFPPVRVFISWSGKQSKYIALALREWLPHIIQAVDPYMSAEDNEAGTLWDEVLTTELNASSFGILSYTCQPALSLDPL